MKAQYLIMSIAFALDPEKPCASKWCALQLEQFRAVRVEDRFTETEKYDPLRTHEPNVWFKKCCSELCSECSGFYAARDLKRRQEILEDLINYL